MNNALPQQTLHFRVNNKSQLHSTPHPAAATFLINKSLHNTSSTDAFREHCVRKKVIFPCTVIQGLYKTHIHSGVNGVFVGEGSQQQINTHFLHQ